MEAVPHETEVIVRVMPTKEELEDYIRKMSGQKAKHGPPITFNWEKGCFERLH